MSPRLVILANNVDEVGGAQRVVHTLAAGFAARGHDVTLIGIESRQHLRESLSSQALPYSVVRLLDEGYVKEPGPELEAQRADVIARLQAILDSGPAGIIITAQVWAMEHVSQCDLAGWRRIGQYHSSFEAASHGPDLQRVLDAYWQADRFLALTPVDAAQFTAAGMPNAEAMPNPLASWPAPAADPQSRVITYLGRFSVEKAPMTLVQAWRILTWSGRLPDWQLQFVGSGPYDRRLREAIDELPRLSVREPVADAYELLTGTGILASPSLIEGLPLAVMEALACGVPVVASDCSAGVRELLDDERCGVLVSRGDAADLARGLATLAENAELRAGMGEHGRRHMESYRLDRVLDRWERLFAQVLR